MELSLPLEILYSVKLELSFLMKQQFQMVTFEDFHQFQVQAIKLVDKACVRWVLKGCISNLSISITPCKSLCQTIPCSYSLDISAVFGGWDRKVMWYKRKDKSSLMKTDYCLFCCERETCKKMTSHNLLP